MFSTGVITLREEGVGQPLLLARDFSATREVLSRS